MKMKLLTLVVVFLLYFSFDNVLSIKTQIKAKSGKFQNMFELLEELSKPSAKKSPAKKEIKKLLKKANNTSVVDPFIFVHDYSTLDLLYRGWLKISSPNLKNYNRYNKLNLPDWSEHEILTGAHFFRKNLMYSLGSDANTKPPDDEFFYFRLSKRNFFYSETMDSVNALDSLELRYIVSAHTLEDFNRSPNCFKVKDTKHLDWILCAENKDKRNKWVCKINEVKGVSDFKTCVDAILSDELPVVQKKILQPVILIPEASPMCNEGYNYRAQGADWECDCKEGKEQSPIDLPPKERSTISPVKPMFEYFDIDVKRVKTGRNGNIQEHENLKIKLEDNAVRIKYKNLGELVTIDGSIYRADEIIFRTPSEHTINGKHYHMEMQVIHHGQTKGDIAKQAVLCFLFEKKPGIYNKFIDDLDFFNLPNLLHPEIDLENNIYIPKVFYDSSSEDVAIMKDFSFYTYQGSLTQPPCTERTIMYVAAKPIPLGSTAIELFQESLRFPDLISTKGDIKISSANPVNNRLIQKRNGRQIYYYDAGEECIHGIPQSKGTTAGHYEKVPRDLTQYYYVSGPRPSGMPGAIVVSEVEARKGGDILNLLG